MWDWKREFADWEADICDKVKLGGEEVRGERGDDLANVLQIGGMCVCFAVNHVTFDEVFEILRDEFDWNATRRGFSFMCE